MTDTEDNLSDYSTAQLKRLALHYITGAQPVLRTSQVTDTEAQLSFRLPIFINHRRYHNLTTWVQQLRQRLVQLHRQALRVLLKLLAEHRTTTITAAPLAVSQITRINPLHQVQQLRQRLSMHHITETSMTVPLKLLAEQQGNHYHSRMQHQTTETTGTLLSTTEGTTISTTTGTTAETTTGTAAVITSQETSTEGTTASQTTGRTTETTTTAAIASTSQVTDTEGG
ncbi:unnamed protein product [Mytilus edulis]|uniref:Uncharacterized protein n=1 Tax=Mytilus edulis TaxID=6550 RepID=A0A8S3PTM1_MYTED|nr:unnamed protein product [Mytilus edulis]